MSTTEPITVPDDDLADALRENWQPKERVRYREGPALTKGMRWVLVIAAALTIISTANGVATAMTTEHDTMTQCVAAGGVYSKTSTEVRCSGR